MAGSCLDSRSIAQTAAESTTSILNSEKWKYTNGYFSQKRVTPFIPNPLKETPEKGTPLFGNPKNLYSARLDWRRSRIFQQHGVTP